MSVKAKRLKKFRKHFPRGGNGAPHVEVVDVIKDRDGLGDLVGVERYLHVPGEVWIGVVEDGKAATVMLSRKKALRLARAITKAAA